MMRILPALTLLTLAACGQSAPERPPLDTAPLAGASIGGDFELVSETGEPVRWDDFAGKWRMVYFGYTFCPDVCPFDVQRMLAGYKTFAENHPDLAETVVPIFITVDPERDTPAKVAEFTDAFSPALLGLTGSREQIDAAAKTFRIYHGKGEVMENGGYLMDHSNQGYLFDPQGKPIALLPVEKSAAGVAAELEKWVR